MGIAAIICLTFLIFGVSKGFKSELEEKDHVVVYTQHGPVKGLKIRTVNDVTAYTFLGIPYAKAPVGNLRFKDPYPIQKWQDIYDATKIKNHCIFIDEYLKKFRGDEDCLHIYITTPSILPDEPLPVMVYIHGEEYRVNGSVLDHRNELIVEKGVVYVHINFRTSLFGLLSLNIKDVPGNAMFKDQALALKWISRYIKAFGGDPDNITLMGHGNGATAVQLHQVSPMSKGLFHKAIAISGAGLCEWTSYTDSKAFYRALLKNLKIRSEDEIDILNHLQEAPVDVLVRAYRDVIIQHKEEHKNPLRAVIEETGDDRFLTETPLVSYMHGHFNDIPMIMSHTSKEFAIYSSDIEYLTADPRNLLRRNWFIEPESEIFEAARRSILDFYLRGATLNSTNVDDFEYLIDLYSDVTVSVPVNEAIRTMIHFAKSPIYYYRFSYRGDKNHPVIDKIGIQGATAGDDVVYLKPTSEEDVFEYRSSDDYVRRRIVKLFTDFAKYGDPTPFGISDLITTKWLPASLSDPVLRYLEFSGDLSMSWEPDSYRMEFWNKLERWLVEQGGCSRNWRETCFMTCPNHIAY